MSLNLLPRPRSLHLGDNVLTLSADPTVAGPVESVALLRDLVGPATGWRLPPAADPTIRLSVDPTLPTEGYRLSIGSDGIELAGGDARGIGWGLQTLRQLLPPDVYAATATATNWRLPHATITDAPRFAWRGVMLDVARWFMPIADVRRFVELAAVHKLNVVHLHLSDDQGWRFESKVYPRLTEVGAWRRETQLIGTPDHGDGIPHGGFYTQAELRELVGFAARRGVTIVPEIDVPGHTQAAIAAYPQLGNHPDRPVEVRTEWGSGIGTVVLNPAPATVRFLTAVLDELIDVFPSEFIHIGGDECRKDEWRDSPAVQRQIADLGLTDEDELQSWFVGQLADHVQRRGRRPIGWDEILEGGLAAGAAVMSWRGEEGGIAAAGSGHDVVMTPHTHTYLNYYQSTDTAHEPPAIGGHLPLEQVWRYDPVPRELDQDADHHILGTQGQLWREFLPTTADVEYMAFPRLCALAEVAWGRTDDDYAAFGRRLAQHLPRLDRLGVGYRRPTAAEEPPADRLDADGG